MMEGVRQRKKRKRIEDETRRNEKTKEEGKLKAQNAATETNDKRRHCKRKVREREIREIRSKGVAGGENED